MRGFVDGVGCKFEQKASLLRFSVVSTPTLQPKVLSSTGRWTAARPLFSHSPKAKPNSTISRPLEGPSFFFPALAAGSVLAFAVRATPLFQWPPAAVRLFNAGRSDFIALDSCKRRTERLSSAPTLSDNNGVRWGIAPRKGFPQLSSFSRYVLTRGVFVMFA